MALRAEIEKRLGDFQLQVQLESGDEVLALLGSSGCGKSVTLRCIAGLLRPDRGRIAVDDAAYFDSGRQVNLPPQERHAGLLFQNYALFPHMTVRQNILAGARRTANRVQRADELLERFELTELAGRLPAQLSGGQQQRTALARILASEPRILLLDEPFSALDSHLRFRMEQELRTVIRQFGRTVVLVSHDRDEVYRLADQVAVLNRGSVEDIGEKRRVFDRPATRSAAILTGCKNISAARAGDDCHLLALDWGIPLETGPGAHAAAFAGIRMHAIAAGPGPNAFLCDVVETVENPFSCTVLLRPAGTAGTPLCWEIEKALWHSLRAAQVQIHLPPAAILLLRA